MPLCDTSGEGRQPRSPPTQRGPLGEEVHGGNGPVGDSESGVIVSKAASHN